MDQTDNDVPLERRSVFPDRNTTEKLNTSELLMLWTIRAWVQDTHGTPTRRYKLQDGLERAGCGDAIDSLCTLLEIVGAAGKRRIEIHATGCLCISTDEKRMLHTLAAQQSGHTLEAFDVLTHLIPGAAARIALGHAESVAASMTRVGLLLPDRAWCLAELSLTHRLRAPRAASTCVRYELH